MSKTTTIPYITEEAADPEVKEFFGEVTKVMGNVPQLLNILVNHMDFAKGFMDIGGAVFGSPFLSIDLKTLLILRTAEINNCNYCRGYYAGLAEQVGLIGDRRDAINNGIDVKDGIFSETEMALLTLTDEMTRKIQVKPEVVERCNKAVGEKGTLEAMMVVGLFNLVNRVAGGAGLPVDK